MTARVRVRPAVLRPPGTIMPVLGAAAALDGLTGLVVLSSGNAYLLRTLGAAAVLPAVAVTLHGLTKVAASPIAGRLVDRRRSGFALSVVPLLAGAGLVTMLATHSLVGYLIGLIALTAGTATGWVVVRHSLGDLTTGADRGAATTWMSLVAGGAAAAGFAAGTVLSSATPRVPFMLGLPLAAATLVLLDRARPPAGPAAGTHEAAWGPPSPPVGSRVAAVTLGLAAGGQFTLSAGLLVAFWPHVIRDLALGSVQVASLLLPAGAVTALTLVTVARRSREGRRLTEVAALYAAVACGLALAAVTDGHGGFALAMAIGIPALAGAAPVVAAAVIDFSRSRTGAAGAIGWLGAAEAAGGLAGSAITGAVIALAGAQAALAALAVLAALISLAVGLARPAAGGRLAPRTSP